MLEITNGDTGELVALTKLPLYYIKRSTKAHGSLIHADNEEDAIGISINGETFNIGDHTELEGRPTAMIREVEDDAQYVFLSHVKAEKAENGNTEVSDALLELDTNVNVSVEEIQSALCELDESVMALQKKANG